ncbi:hypothetical protein D9M72_655560 [compost metagenome]
MFDGGAYLFLGGHRREGDGCAAKTATCHAGSDGSVGPGGVDGQVQFGARNLEVVTHGTVAGIEERPNGARAG